MLWVRMADYGGFDWRLILGLFKESLESACRAVNEECLDSPGHSASCSDNS